MRYRYILVLAIAINMGTWSAFASDYQAVIPGEIESVDRISIPAIVGDFAIQSPILKIKINGQGPFLFMLDTGSSKTMISKSLAKKLNLPITRIRGTKVATPNQVVNVFHHAHVIHNIQIGDLNIKDYEVFSSSAYEDEDQFYTSIHVDGVLSASVFYGMLVTIDYKHEKIHIQKGALDSKDNDVIPTRKDIPVPVIQGKIIFDKLKKEEMQDFILDTGDGAYVYVNMCNIPEMKKFRNQETLLGYDFYEKSFRTSLAELYGDIIFSKSVILKSPYITFSAMNCDYSIGRLGRKFFETHEITLDEKNNLVRIKPYK